MFPLRAVFKYMHRFRYVVLDDNNEPKVIHVDLDVRAILDPRDNLLSASSKLNSSLSDIIECRRYLKRLVEENDARYRQWRGQKFAAYKAADGKPPSDELAKQMTDSDPTFLDFKFKAAEYEADYQLLSDILSVLDVRTRQLQAASGELRAERNASRLPVDGPDATNAQMTRSIDSLTEALSKFRPKPDAT